MNKKVVIGITVTLLLAGAIIMVYGGAQLVSPEEKVKVVEERSPLGMMADSANKAYETSLDKFKGPRLPTLPEGGNEIILGIIFIAGGIVLYVKRDKITK